MSGMKGLAIIFAVMLGLGGYWVWTQQVRPLAEVFFGYGHVRHEWNQKLTLTVATPDGPKTGAAVVTVAAIFGNRLSGHEVNYGHKGEATVVEIAPGKYLFALLSGSDERFYSAARDRFEGKRRGEWLYDIPNQTEPVELTGDAVPLLVTFTDIDDPTTVTRVDPDDLDAAFGCDLYDGAALPWRVAGQTWGQWAKDWRAEEGRRLAGPEIGLSPQVAAWLAEKDRLEEHKALTDAEMAQETARTGELNAAILAAVAEERTGLEAGDIFGDDRYAEERRALQETARTNTADQQALDRWNNGRVATMTRAWEKAQYRLAEEARAPTLEDLIPGSPRCHNLTAVTLEITKEPAVPWKDGEVAKVLPQTFFERWGLVHEEALARGFDDPYFDSLLGGLSRAEFQVGGK